VIHLFERCGCQWLAGRIGVSYRLATERGSSVQRREIIQLQGHRFSNRSVTLSGKVLCLFSLLSQNIPENMPGRLKQDAKTSIL
jgi:hypothetical protein